MAKGTQETELLTRQPSSHIDSTSGASPIKAPNVGSGKAWEADSQEARTIYSEDDGAHGEGTVKMKKELGLMDGVGLIVGIIVGSGIFISPTGVIQYSGSPGAALCIWATTGLLSMIGALCYAELGTMIPKSGGDYAYILQGFGDLPAFLFLWVALMIIVPTGNAVIALTFANYIIKPFFSTCEESPDSAVRLIAAIVICFLTWINCWSVKWATKIQDIFTVTKIFALLIIICAGIVHLALGNTENYADPFAHTDWGAGAIATAFYQGLFSFSGWNYLNFVIEELKDPYRNLPRAIWISMPLVTSVYVLANVAYFAVLTPDEVLSSSAVAVLFGNRMLGVMWWTMPFFVACSTFGSLNGGIFASSRLFFVGARQGHLPSCLALISIHKFTPVPTLLFLCVLTLLMLVTSDVQVLINYTSFTESLFILITITALLWMRYRYPKMHRPIKVWIGFPIIFFLICTFLVALPIIERPIELGIAIAVLMTGVPVYFLGIYWKKKPTHCLDFIYSTEQ